jgi:uncharacterized protein (DUF2235 family)
MTKLAVFFDGTWNTPTDRTNVYKLYKLLDEVDLSKQQGVYIPGVGTEKGGLLSSVHNFFGGAFGDGLSKNILQGYRWLIDIYKPGDEIFIIGFSRGAYSARSLAGLIRNCGLLRKENISAANEAYNMYRDKLGPESEAAKEFRKELSFDVDISFVGVWDTVGSLGIPVKGFSLPGFNDHYQFHDTQLSRRVRAAYHGLAINEFRSPYEPTFWTKADALQNARPDNLPVEQRWFIGAHSNVGGGYAQDRLCNVTCRWIQKMAQKHGLEFFSDWPVGDEDYSLPPRDSYSEFVGEHRGLDKVVERVCRTVGSPDTLNETLDPSVKRRIEADPKFLSGDMSLKAALLKLPLGHD